MALLFFLLLLCGIGVQGQPCTPLSILPAPWPESRPHSQDAISETIDYLYYAGGKYFVMWTETVKPPGGDTTDFPFVAVSEDLRHWQPVRLDGRSGFLPSLYYWRGHYYLSPGVSTMRSQDGVTWEPLPAPGWMSFTTNGKLLIAFSQFGDLWTSEDGADWRYRSSFSGLTRPTFGAQAKATRLVFTAGRKAVGYTEDFVTWHQREPPFLVATPRGVLQGWVVSGFDRSRDGESWVQISRPENNDPNYHYIGPPYPFIAGQEMVGLLSRPRYENGKLADPPTEALFLLRTRGLEGWREKYKVAELVGEKGKKVYRFGYEGKQGWDGKQFFTRVTWHGPEGPQAEKAGIAVFSCADVGDPQVLVGVAREQGAGGSFWQSSLFLHYPGEQQGEVLLQWLPFAQENREPREVRVWLNPGESREYRDVLEELFPGVSGAGSLRVVSVGSTVVAAARTYTEGAAGSFGQEITPWCWQEGISQGEEGLIPGLADSGSLQEGFRTNLGVQNLWVEPVEVEVVFRGQNGQELGRLQKRLRAFEGYQWFRPLGAYAPVKNVSALVRIVGESQSRIAAYASRIDNRTSDGTTLRAFRLPAQGTVP